MGALAKVLVRSGRSLARPDQGGWEPALHIGPLRDPTGGEARTAARWLVRHRHDLAWLHSRLADDASRSLLVDLLAYRLAGGRRIAFGPDGETRRNLTRFAQTALLAEHLADGSARYDLDPIGSDLAVRAAPVFAIQTFVLEQYRHPTIEAPNVRPGDHVIDGGAFWGDTALWLAEQCGPDGHVTAFEADPANLPVLEANLADNPELAARVTVRNEALWRAPARLCLNSLGAASCVGLGSDPAVDAMSIDALVEQGELERADFVKLDIEGAELAALRGAEETIRRFRPRFAIAAYHRREDLIELPRWLDGVAPGYAFALTHQSLHQFDTVLFAWPEDC